MNPKIYTTAQMRVAEEAAVVRGTSLLQLMENAGTLAAQEMRHRFPAARRVLMICGKGNNGGDALVMARVLATDGIVADILLLLGENLSELAQINRNRLPTTTRILTDTTCVWSDYDVLVDAVFGTGFSGALPPQVAALLHTANRASAHKIALDIPSGMNCDNGAVSPDTFRADLTCTFGAYKPAHRLNTAIAYCGEVVCLDIGV